MKKIIYSFIFLLCIGNACAAGSGYCISQYGYRLVCAGSPEAACEAFVPELNMADYVQFDKVYETSNGRQYCKFKFTDFNPVINPTTCPEG